MNSIDDFLKWLTLMIPLVISPGPANITIAAISSRSGFRKTIPFILGVITIDLCATPLIGLGCGFLFVEHPLFFRTLETAGVFYIFYLAFQYSRVSSNKCDNGGQTCVREELGYLNGVFLACLNPKTLAIMLMMFTQFLEVPKNLYKEIVILTGLFVLICLIAHFIWAQFGAILRRWLKTDGAKKIQALVFSLALGLVAIWLLVENIQAWFRAFS